MSSDVTVGEIGPSRKRTRTDDSASCDAPPLVVQHPLLWLDDGNIVLRTTSPTTAESPATQMLYKVHKSILALNATFFEEMFAGGTAIFDIASEQYKGLPVIDMPDLAEDVEAFLKSIFVSNWMSDLYRDGVASSGAAFFPVEFAAVLRLATKYGAMALRRSAVEALKAVWPSSLLAWDQVRGSRRDAMRRDLEDATRASGVVFGSPEFVSVLEGVISRHVPNPAIRPATALRLALDCDVPEILPVVYYDLASVHVVVPSESLGHPIVDARQLNVDLANLNAAELITLLKATSYLWSEFLRCFPEAYDLEINEDLYDTSCESPQHCKKVIEAWWSDNYYITLRKMHYIINRG
ncbi:hypothetical protein K488DRAFT_68311 [Vararia minispora EC-137]|uniref:Uncharacterized protein n=1 Tax=Vararia minispora EC-137 TaxID=1314806 RepID=A0ACB8QUL2_9AGAM|nr:hypothetical protein K488DRAFT_68311 [Vararia minispora EC-137]